MTTLPESINLYGWDTAFVTSFTKANQAIKNCNVTPPSFNYSANNSSGAQIGQLQGDWDAWQLSTNGGGQNLTLECPVKKGTFFSKAVDQGKTFTLDGGRLEIEVTLDYFDEHNPSFQDPTAQPGTGGQKNLAVRTTSSSQDDVIVSINRLNFDFSGASNKDEAAALCKAYFTKWFLLHLGEFNHNFAQLVVNQIAVDSNLQWLKPTDMGYAVGPVTNDANASVFAVLAMTEGRFKGNNAHLVNPKILEVVKTRDKAKSDVIHSAFAISPQLFAQKWLLAALRVLRPGGTDDDLLKEFSLSDDGLSWANTTEIQWATFKDKDNNPVAAKIPTGKFSLGVHGTSIKVDFQDLYWDISDGVTVHVTYTDFYTLRLKSGADPLNQSYSNVLLANSAPKPTLVITTEISSGKQWRDLGIDIGLVVIGAVVGVLIGAAAEGVGPAEEAFTAELATATKNGLSRFATDVSSSLEELTVYDAEGDELELTAVNAERLQQAADDATTDIDRVIAKMNAKAPRNTVLEQVTGRVKDFGTSMWSTKWKLICSLGGALVAGLIGFIPRMVDNAKNLNLSELPSLNDFGQNCAGSVKWPDSSGFKLTSAALDGALVLGGDLQKS